MKRKLLIILAVVVALLVVCAVALPLLVNVDSFRPTIEAQASSALGRKVEIGHMQLSIMAGGVKADDVSIADDPAFSRTPFLKAKSLEVGVDMLPLILSRSLNVRSFTLVEPEVSLLHSASGKWNFSSLGAKKETAGGGGGQNVSVGKLDIQKARISVGRTGGKRQVYDNVDVEASNISYGSAFPFTVQAATPGGGSLKVEGKAGPINRTDASETPFDAKVEAKSLDIGATGFVPPDSGLAGVVDYTGTIRSDGKTLRSEGSANAQKLKLVKAGSPARQPVGLDYASDYDLQRQAGTLSKGEVKTGSSRIRLAGNYDARGSDMVVHLKLNGQNMPIQDLAGLLPALGVNLPAGSSLQGGTVTTNLSVDGPLSGLVTTGPIDVANVKLAGFNLGSKLSAIGALAGIRGGPDTNIQSMSSRLRIAPDGMRADDLNVVVPEIGTVTGAGTISSSNALNFRLLAKLANSASLAAGLGKIAGMGSNKGIPILVQGTTSNPVFLPDMAGVMQNTVTAPVQGVQGLGDALGGLFGKKKKTPQQ